MLTIKSLKVSAGPQVTVHAFAFGFLPYTL
jgi:hypothetical protein